MTVDTVTYGTIIYRVEDGIAFLTFNRPESLNAFNRQMAAETIAACQAINDDPSVRVVIVTGAGERAFSVGMDLKERAASEPLTPVDHRASRLRPVTGGYHRAIAALDPPTIAAIRGFAVGGGLETALACDLRIAAEDAKLGLPEVRHGIMPGAGGTQRLARVVGQAHALKMALTAEPIDAQEAYRIGLVTQVVLRDDLMSAAVALASTIKKGAPIASRFVKEAINKGSELSIEEGIRLEVDLSTILNQTEDAKEGPRAFAEKRAPQWKGR